MMTQELKALHDKMKALQTEGKDLLAIAEPNADQASRIAAIPDEITSVEASIRKNVLDSSLLASDDFMNSPARDTVLRAVAGAPQANPQGPELFASVLKSVGRAKFFGMTEGNRREAATQAYRFGLSVMAMVLPSDDKYGAAKAFATRKCKELKIPISALASAMMQAGGVSAEFMAAQQVEGINEDGGNLVNPEFDNSILVLREKFGVFRRYARATPMSSDTKTRRRRKTGLTAYWGSEAASLTESKMTWDTYQLVAKKLYVRTQFSTELNEDAITDMGDTLAGEMAYQFSLKEDQAGFNGDGTSTYGGINGVRNRLLGVYGTGGGVGLKLAAAGHDTWPELTMADFTAVVGALPQYPEDMGGEIAWFNHKVFWGTVMLPLMLASGGVTLAEVAAGAPRRFLGYPVVITQAMPSTTAVSQVPTVYGDLALAADLGDRRQTTVFVSDQFHFDTDEIGVRATERIDINVHDVGDTTNPGPIVGLLTTAS